MEDFNLIFHIENSVNITQGDVLSPKQSSDKILQALISRQISYLEVVAKLGAFILNPDEEISTKAKDVFITILKELPKDYLGREEVLHLLMFFSGIINSNSSMCSSFPLNGLKILVECPEFPSDQALLLLKNLSGGLYIPALIQKDRFALYQIVSLLLKHYMPDLQQSNDQFLNDFVQLIDGERDPQCLHLLFQLILPIAENFNISLFVEDLFNIISCYFPVDFTPPPNCSIGITREDLVELLEKCLTCTPDLGEHVLPLIMEKLDADVVQAKLDSLHLLCEGCSVYPLSAFRPVVSTLWSALGSEILEGRSEEVKEAALTAVTQLSRAFSKETMETEGQTLLEEFIGDIWTDSKHYLLEPKLRKVHSAARIVQHAMKGSPHAYSILGEKVFSLVVEMFHSNQEFPVRSTILGILTDTLVCSKEVDPHKGSAIDARDQTIGLFFTVLQEMDVDLVTSSLRGLARLIDWRDYFSDHYVQLLVGHLLLLLESSNLSVRKSANELLKEFVKSLPEEASDSIYSPFLKKVDTEQQLVKVEILFEVLSSAWITQATQTLVLPSILEYSWREWTRGSELYKPAVLCIATMAKYGANEVFVQALPILISLGLQHPPNSDVGLGCCSSIENITKAVDSFLVEYLVQDLFSLCINTPKEVSGFQQLAITKFHTEALGPVILSTVASLDRQIVWSLAILRSLLEQSLRDPSLAPVVASLLNKSSVSQATEFVDGPLSNTISTAPLNKNLVTVVAWLAKALIIRGHSHSPTLSHQLAGWLDHPEVGQEAAEGFGLIPQDSKALSTKGHAIVNLLYKQKFYMTTMPHLVERYPQASEEFKCNYLIAMTSILSRTPSAVIKEDVSKLLPMLVTSLIPIPDNQKVVSSLLSTLILFVRQSPNMILSHLNPLISSSLNLASSTTNTMITRTNALELLVLLSELPEYDLLPFRKQVVHDLIPVLDDGKRVVRKNAVAARNNWVLIGQPRTSTYF